MLAQSIKANFVSLSRVSFWSGRKSVPGDAVLLRKMWNTYKFLVQGYEVWDLKG